MTVPSMGNLSTHLPPRSGVCNDIGRSGGEEGVGNGGRKGFYMFIIRTAMEVMK